VLSDLKNRCRSMFTGQPGIRQTGDVIMSNIPKLDHITVKEMFKSAYVKPFPVLTTKQCLKSAHVIITEIFLN